MPDLEAGNLSEAYAESKKDPRYGKFTSDGGRIVWATGRTLHKEILGASGMEDTPDTDMGRFSAIKRGDQRVFRVYGRSSDFFSPRKIEVRNRTLRLWREIVEPEGYGVEPQEIRDIIDTVIR